MVFRYVLNKHLFFFILLDFKLDDSIKSSIKQAHVNFKEATDKLQLKNFELKTIGRKFAKKNSLSPDSFMQTAFQIAFYKLYGRFVATYESASTSAFKLGRTETVRPATLATKAIAEYMKNNSANLDRGELIKMLRDCTKLHNQLVKEGAMGQVQIKSFPKLYEIIDVPKIYL